MARPNKKDSKTEQYTKDIGLMSKFGNEAKKNVYSILEKREDIRGSLYFNIRHLTLLLKNILIQLE